MNLPLGTAGGVPALTRPFPFLPAPALVTLPSLPKPLSLPLPLPERGLLAFLRADPPPPHNPPPEPRPFVGVEERVASEPAPRCPPTPVPLRDRPSSEREPPLPASPKAPQTPACMEPLADCRTLPSSSSDQIDVATTEASTRGRLSATAPHAPKSWPCAPGHVSSLFCMCFVSLSPSLFPPLLLLAYSLCVSCGVRGCVHGGV